jgi:hypothetical protein
VRNGRDNKSESLIEVAGQVRGDGLLSQGRRDAVFPRLCWPRWGCNIVVTPSMADISPATARMHSEKSSCAQCLGMFGS